MNIDMGQADRSLRVAAQTAIGFVVLDSRTRKIVGYHTHQDDALHQALKDEYFVIRPAGDDVLEKFLRELDISRADSARLFIASIAERFPSYIQVGDQEKDPIKIAGLIEDRIRKDVLSAHQLFLCGSNWTDYPAERAILWPDNADLPYTKEDLAALCKGDAQTAFALYACCLSGGACPETVIDEDSHEPEEDQCFAICNQGAATHVGHS